MTPTLPDVDPNEAEHLAAEHGAEEILAVSFVKKETRENKQKGNTSSIGRRKLSYIEMTIPLAEETTTDELRAELLNEFKMILGKRLVGVHLCTAQAGSGKSYAALQAVQEMTKPQNGAMRGLWAAGQHRMFNNLAAEPHFDPSLWYHYLPMGPTTDNPDPLCRYHETQKTWLQKGYQSSDLCTALCKNDGHRAVCPYLAQRKVESPLIFVMHQHLAKGLALQGFNFAVIDEIPLGAFWEWVHIPADKIVIKGAGVKETELLQKLKDLCDTRPASPISGRPLFDSIADLVDEAETATSEGVSSMPQKPFINRPEDAEAADYWFFHSFLEEAVAELKKYRSKEKQDRLWAERIRISRQTYRDGNGDPYFTYGLQILRRTELWAQLPETIIQLDATAHEEVYKQIFTGKTVKPIALKSPPFAGRAYQVVGNSYGIEDTRNRTSAGNDELFRYCLHIQGFYPGERVGIICHKHMRDGFAVLFGEENVQYFYNQRGDNRLKDVRALIVVGTPNPDPQSIIDIATALDPKRGNSFLINEKTGEDIEIYKQEERRFLVTNEYHKALGGVPQQKASCYTNPILDSIFYQSNAAELTQAAARARGLYRHDVDVWIFSGTPTNIPLSGCWSTLPISHPATSPLVYGGRQKEGKRYGPGIDNWLKFGMEKELNDLDTVTVEDFVKITGLGKQEISRGGWVKFLADAFPLVWKVATRNPWAVARIKPNCTK